MGLQGNPFSGTQFGGGSPMAPPDDPMTWLNQQGAGTVPQAPSPSPTAPSGPPGMYPADISPDMDPKEQYSRAKRYLDSLIAQPKTYSQMGEIKEDPAWANQVAAAQKQVNDALAAYRDDVERQRDLADYQMKRADQQGDSATARANSAYVAQLNHELRMLEQTQQQGFEMEKLGKTQEFQAGQTQQGFQFQKEMEGLGQENKLAQMAKAQDYNLQQMDKEQSFAGEQNRLNREIQNMANQLAAGRINMETALGTIDKWLQAQQYTLPQGAEYVPGFQPGGAVQEAARLAGVGYNPSNYKANTVPFDPAAVVRQTMGR